MKKILLLFAILGLQTIVQAQFNVGVNPILQILQGDFKQSTPTAFGGCASVGYTFDQRLDLSIVYSLYKYNNRQELGFDSKTLEAKFFFFNENIRPYIGCGVGLYTKTIDFGNLPKKTENVWGFEPKVGILLDSKIVTNLFIDTSVSYINVKTKFNSPQAFNVALGLKYIMEWKNNN